MYGLLYFSQRQSRCSSSEIESLRLAAEMTAETSSDVALLNAANILLYLDQPHDAKGVLNRMSASSRRVAGSNACSLKASNLRGWLELASGEGRQGSATSAERHFAASLGEAPSDVDAMLGLAACYSMRNDWSGALAVLNQAIAATTFGDASSSSSSSSSSSISSLSSSDGGGGRYSEGVPCLVEKARMLANCGDWAQAEVTAQPSAILEAVIDNIISQSPTSPEIDEMKKTMSIDEMKDKGANIDHQSTVSAQPDLRVLRSPVQLTRQHSEPSCSVCRVRACRPG